MKSWYVLAFVAGSWAYASEGTSPCPKNYLHVAPSSGINADRAVSERTTSYLALLEMLAQSGVRAEPLAVDKPTGKVKDVPFGKFKFNGVEYDYAEAPPAAKKLESGSNEVFFGRKATSLADAKKLATRYFTEGLDRPLHNAHFDIARHQGDAGQPSANGKNIVYDSATSGFSNGSEAFGEARFFASQTPVGVVFVMDTKGQELLNLTAWNEHEFGDGSRYAPEREVLTKGGRSPTRVRAAVIFENGKPVAFYTNPNYQPGGGR